MLPIERLETIKEIARKEKKIYVSKLSQKFNVAEETIRRDLDKLEKQGILTRSHGGANLRVEERSNNKSFVTILEGNSENEKYIAKKTVELIREYSTIIADCSKIVLEVLRMVRDRDDLTVITNSIEVLKELNQSNLNIISTGGIVNSKGQSLQGNITQKSIGSYNVDIALINCSGIDINKGVLDLNETEVEIKRRMIRQAKKIALLADSIKFDKISLEKLLDYEDIDYIVTDTKPKGEWMNLFQSHNIEVNY
ncbi:transcriptional regulator, DeoR family [Clostridium sp. DL-VIII]|uniref:DeoR/GlpR family DNA-binding transcription regulator n=1 Tax=Clostridium sp. DL-VIII TaxID=641107 RepID=UPI00023B0162|nr:DeoR/GlpR family DNA-binding transcription regulator [Clostridium sp. DL-VIII]EHI99216.1 transcriptional regulator, DeoR family [Clostridium sp. DL-VIII]